MKALVRSRWNRGSRRSSARKADPTREATSEPVRGRVTAQVDIAPNDAVLAFFQSAGAPVDIEKLKLESPGLDALREAGVALVVPLVSQGELIGLLNLGPRLSEQEYSVDDRRLLDNLASQAAPAVRVAQLVREQEAEIRTRERYEQELRIAHLIQQNFLPREAPEVDGWQLSAFYRSAREVGGDFYDFIDLDDGKIGVVVGDVTDKGVPAALVMAATRSVLRGAAQRGLSPGEVLARVNDLVCPEMPDKMFVTCLYAIVDPNSGHMIFANAGHNLPYRKALDCVEELKARGMPLGLMEGMIYDEVEVTVGRGETVLFTSDGIAEAHSPDGEMFGCPKIVEVINTHEQGADLRDDVLAALHGFTGPDWEQEDDITMVVLERSAHEASDFAGGEADGERRLVAFTVPSARGNERQVMERVAEAVAAHGFPAERLERLKTAVSEAAMNAIEHGNDSDPDKSVDVEVFVGAGRVRVLVTDLGGAEVIDEAPVPDLDAKLAGEQSPRGWGLFLIKNMVDEMKTTAAGDRHTVELVMNEEGDA